MFISRATALLFFSAILGANALGGESSSSNSDSGTTRNVVPVLPDVPFQYEEVRLPAHFQVETERFHGQQPMVAADNTPEHNPITNQGATLGRVLFYDVNLSSNRTVACASCHVAENGFSDPRVLSLGFDGGETGRHAMGLTNARFYGQGRFFWDQRAATLEDQVLMPFQDPVEMGMTLDGVVARVSEADYYPGLFEAAFGDSGMTSERISLALAQFVRSMVSTTSRYDEGRSMVANRSDDFPNFSDQENLGKRLFSNPPPRGGMGCFACHQGEGFIAARAESNGLDADPSVDPGFGKLTNLSGDMGTFKVPSLRNVAVRAPYMHDGRFASLIDVINHYSDGVEDSPNVRPPLSMGHQENMSQQQKDALVAFLMTLTDDVMLSDPKFSDPFAVAD